MMTERWTRYVAEIARREGMVLALVALGAALVVGWVWGRWGVQQLGLARWWPLAYAAGLGFYLYTVVLCLQLR